MVKEKDWFGMRNSSTRESEESEWKEDMVGV